jgi:site-specific recombinase XerD
MSYMITLMAKSVIRTKSQLKSAPANKGQRYPAEILTPDEVKALIGACSSRAPTGIRNRGVIVVLYRGGLRISEALALKLKDLDRDAGTIRVLHGKGDRARTVGLDPTAFAVIERWLDRRSSLGINSRALLFCTLDGKPLATAYVRALLPRLAKRAEIEKRVHAHGLRHTHAAELAREGVPVNVIQAQLGHASLAVTDRYIRHIAPEQLIEAMRARVWEI